jgi:hypothetical protein
VVFAMIALLQFFFLEMPESDEKPPKERPLPLPMTPITIDAVPGLLAGFSRTFLTKSVLFGLSIVREVIQWWFRVPIKMFRPYAVNPWMVLNEMAITDGKQLTYRYVQTAVKREGWRVVALNVLPLMLANGTVGAVLFHTYTVASSRIQSPYRFYLAGGIAGLFSSTVSTPMDRLTRMIVKGHSVQQRHQGIHHAAHSALKAVRGDLLSKIRFFYRGFGFNSIKFSDFMQGYLGIQFLFWCLRIPTSMGQTMYSKALELPPF